MALSQDFTTDPTPPDVVVALALIYGMMSEMPPPQRSAVLNAAITALPLDGSETIAEARRRLEMMLRRIE
jgi:hypothetical protein